MLEVVRALTVEPGRGGSLAVTSVAEPEPRDDDLLVEGLAIGVCGTDKEIVAGRYGWAPPGSDRLVLGNTPQPCSRVGPVSAARHLSGAWPHAERLGLEDPA